MAKDLEFVDYSAITTDEDGDEHESVITAAIIGSEHVYVKDVNGNNVRREVMTPTGARQVIQGDVFVKTERDGVYDHLTAAGWASTGYPDEVQDDESAPAKKAVSKR